MTTPTREEVQASIKQEAPEPEHPHHWFPIWVGRWSKCLGCGIKARNDAEIERIEREYPECIYG